MSRETDLAEETRGLVANRADADVVAARLRAEKFKPYIIKQ